MTVARPIPILYEDNHLLVVEKPANLLSQSDETGDPDLLSELKQMIKVRDAKPGNVYLGLVHRLDRPVGGTMVFAKTSKAASRLSDAVRRRAFEKIYWTIVHGEPKQAQDSLAHWLLKDEKTNTVRPVEQSHPGAKEARLDYRILKRIGSYSLLEIQLHTGRPHQIRVQCAAIGHAIVGDQKYGHTTSAPTSQIALWSHSLSFDHPVRDEWMTFTSNPPRQEPWTRFTL